MAGKSKPPQERMDYQITFCLQRSIGDRLKQLCDEDQISLQDCLRFLVDRYLEVAEQSREVSEAHTPA